MNRFLVLISVFLALCACKTQRTIAPFILRDSISITYKQGKEQPTPTGVRGAAIESICVIEESGLKQPCQSGTLTSCKAQSTGKGGALATRNKKGAAIAMVVNSPQGVRNPREISAESVRDIKIRVDTVFVERWHTEIVESQKKKVESAKPDKPIPRFYKRCTWGFFILILLLFGRIAFKLMKLIYLRR